MNRTLVEMTRCLLDDAKLPDKLWVEALQTAVYIRNRCETRAVEKTPFEMFWGIKPNLQHLRAFGCPAVTLIKGGNRSKLSRKGIECKLIGYSSNHKGYRLLCEDGKIIVSRSVKFLEDVKGNHQMQISVDEENSDLKIEEPLTDTSESVRRNPGRACKVELQSTHHQDWRRKVNKQKQCREVPKREESSDTEVPQQECADSDTTNELAAPSFKIGAETSISAPNSFKDATSGPWSRFW